jgi:hypothetical protein
MPPGVRLVWSKHRGSASFCSRAQLLTLAVTNQPIRQRQSLERVSICVEIGILEYAMAIHVENWNFEISWGPFD